MSLLQPFISQVRTVDFNTRIHKDECAYSFATPKSEGGLYISLVSFLGIGKDFIDFYSKKTGEKLFLHFRQVKKEPEDYSPPKKKPTLLQIGGEEGFNLNQNEIQYEDVYTLVILPSTTLPINDKDIPLKIQMTVEAVIKADSATKKDEVAKWEGQPLVVSNYAENLVQFDNGVKIPFSGWKCSECDLTSNLWLNLTDGKILCGRKTWDGTGGNGHALEHFQKTKHPLCVKLGTITANGKADVYSYAEDEMVLDPKLEEHLAHFGINVSQMSKTEKTMAELEIDLNFKFESKAIEESGKELKPLKGPGLTGLYNTGNSCYFNTIFQTLFSIPEIREKYYKSPEKLFADAPTDPTSDFKTQMSKLAYALFSKDAPEEVAPRTLKNLIGKGHPEFSTMRQQDTLEYYQHLLTTIERLERAGSDDDVTRLFKFKVEDRIQCATSGNVKYTYKDENVLSLPIPLEAALNKDQIKMDVQTKEEEHVYPRVPIQSCLEAFAQSEHVPDFYSPAINATTTAIKTTRLSTFPKYLWVQVRRFTVNQDWTPKKLAVWVDVPDNLDLELLRGKGIQPGETPLPEGTVPVQEKKIDESLVSQLAEMGFAVNGCRRAVHATNNQGLDAAMNWVLEHMGDPDFDTPLEAPKAQTQVPEKKVDQEAMVMLQSMGFSEGQARRALLATDNNLERATDYIFSHMDEPDLPTPESSSASSSSAAIAPPIKDEAPAKYRLHGFISHIGRSTQSGHYVCHLRVGDKWVQFNDSHVYESINPPKDYGYFYLFVRNE